MKAIVYSLFGYDRERHKDCFDFNSYLRGLAINIRMAKLIYPDWKIILETDKATHNGWWKLFSKLPIEVHVNEDNTPLTKAMLWRLKPVFEMENGKPKYTHIICRDLDSPLTYREAQSVHYWISKDKSMHAITDSVSHGIPLLGGMIGIRCDYFKMRMACESWEQLMGMSGSMNFNQKGMDQEFLCKIVYPKFAQHGDDSITQHYCLGMPDTFLSDYHTTIEDISIGVPERLRDSNAVCGHIGAAGWYETELFRFLRAYWNEFTDLLKIESDYPHIFYWTT